MSCNCQVSPCRHSNSRMLTSLHFGVFLFAFAMFVAFTPFSYLSTGVAVMADSAATMGDAFALGATSLNREVADFFVSQAQVAEDVGAGLAYVGNSAGEGASELLYHPAEFRDNVRANVAVLGPILSLKKSDVRSWNERYRTLLEQKHSAVAAVGEVDAR